MELDGSPRDNVKVSLESGAVTTYQGVTKEYDLAYNVSSRPGEIRIRGAHVGDRVTAIARIDGSGALPDILLGSVDVEDRP